MSVTAASVKARAKEFTSLDDSEVNTAIADAQVRVNAAVLETLGDLGVTYFAAHLLSLSNPSLAQAAGPIASETVGQVSRSYAVAASRYGDPALARTRWGLEFLSLIKNATRARFMVT